MHECVSPKGGLDVTPSTQTTHVPAISDLFTASAAAQFQSLVYTIKFITLYRPVCIRCECAHARVYFFFAASANPRTASTNRVLRPRTAFNRDERRYEELQLKKFEKLI